MPRSPPSMGTPVVRGPKDCTTRTGPQPEATSIVGSRSRPCPRSVPRHTSAPILGSTLHWRIVDAARGDLKEGHAEQSDLAKRKPWDYGELRTVDDAVIVGSGPNGLAAAIELAR